MKLKNKTTGKEYYYSYANLFIKTDVATDFRERAKSQKMTQTQLLETLLNQTKPFELFTNGNKDY